LLGLGHILIDSLGKNAMAAIGSALFYTVTTPIGVAIGIGIASVGETTVGYVNNILFVADCSVVAAAAVVVVVVCSFVCLLLACLLTFFYGSSIRIIVQGVLDSFAAGILIYSSLVSLLGIIFQSKSFKRLLRN
jgi:hypothetical protein